MPRDDLGLVPAAECGLKLDDFAFSLALSAALSSLAADAAVGANRRD